MILGIDEVGRGPWAGPLVVGAVVLGDVTIEGLTDSKKLTKKKREALDGIIRANAIDCSIGWVDANELDAIGLAQALKLATIRAVEQIKVPYHEIIIDGTVNFLNNTSKGAYVTTLAKADVLIPAVSAASIIAKVARDRFMSEQATIYKEYGFATHVGYGTAAHRQAIEKRGVTPLHRLSFAPLVKYSSTKQIGDTAEAIVAEHLTKQGHAILARNWRTRWCEIDIISSKDTIIYATEVKYRKHDRQGGGMAVMTPQKVRYLRFAIELYAARHHLHHLDRRLLIADVGGDFQLRKLIEIE